MKTGKQGVTPAGIPYEVVGTDVVTDEKFLAYLETQEDIADAEHFPDPPTNVNFRWTRSRVAAVKRAAAIMDMSYQAYIKHVVFKQAMADLAEAAHVFGPGARRDDPNPRAG